MIYTLNFQVKGVDSLPNSRLKRFIFQALALVCLTSRGMALPVIPSGGELCNATSANLSDSNNVLLYTDDINSSVKDIAISHNGENHIPVTDIIRNPGIVEEAFRKACYRDFQQPASLHIAFGKTPSHKLIGGYFSSISLKAFGGGVDYVKLSGFHMECRGVHFDLPALLEEGKLDVRLVDSMDMSVSVKEEAFNSLFNTHSQRMDVRNPKIEMFDGEISFSGTVKAFLFKSRISARGPLEIDLDGKVSFNLNRLRVSGVNIPRFMVRKISSSINPIADFNKFKFWKCWNMNLRTVIVKPGMMTLSSYGKEEPILLQMAESVQPANVLSESKKG